MVHYSLYHVDGNDHLVIRHHWATAIDNGAVRHFRHIVVGTKMLSIRA